MLFSSILAVLWLSVIIVVEANVDNDKKIVGIVLDTFLQSGTKRRRELQLPTVGDLCTRFNNVSGIVNGTNCTCGLTGLTTAEMTCTSDEQCILNNTVCYNPTVKGQGTMIAKPLKGSVTLETSFETCFEYVKGYNSTNCATIENAVTYKLRTDTTRSESCTATVNNQTCQSCNRTACPDGDSDILVDCDNEYSEASSDGCQDVVSYLESSGVSPGTSAATESIATAPNESAGDLTTGDNLTSEGSTQDGNDSGTNVTGDTRSGDDNQNEKASSVNGSDNPASGGTRGLKAIATVTLSAVLIAMSWVNILW